MIEDMNLRNQEYLASLQSLTNLQPLITARAQQRHDRGPWHLFTLAPGLEAFLNGEPERSRRVLNLLVANDLAWCDHPASDRPAFCRVTCTVALPTVVWCWRAIGK
jgi:hypothetical protein